MTTYTVIHHNAYNEQTGEQGTQIAKFNSFRQAAQFAKKMNEKAAVIVKSKYNETLFYFGSRNPAVKNHVKTNHDDYAYYN